MTRDPLGPEHVTQPDGGPSLDLGVRHTAGPHRSGPGAERPQRPPQLAARDVLEWARPFVDIQEIQVKPELGSIVGVPVPPLRSKTLLPASIDRDRVPEVEVREFGPEPEVGVHHVENARIQGHTQPLVLQGNDRPLIIRKHRDPVFLQDLGPFGRRRTVWTFPALQFQRLPVLIDPVANQITRREGLHGALQALPSTSVGKQRIERRNGYPIAFQVVADGTLYRIERNPLALKTAAAGGIPHLPKEPELERQPAIVDGPEEPPHAPNALQGKDHPRPLHPVLHRSSLEKGPSRTPARLGPASRLRFEATAAGSGQVFVIEPGVRPFPRAGSLRGSNRLPRPAPPCPPRRGPPASTPRPRARRGSDPSGR